MSHTINGEDLRLLWHEIEYGYRSNKEIARKTTCPTLKDAHKISASIYYKYGIYGIYLLMVYNIP